MVLMGVAAIVYLVWFATRDRENAKYALSGAAMWLIVLTVWYATDKAAPQPDPAPVETTLETVDEPETREVEPVEVREIAPLPDTEQEPQWYDAEIDLVVACTYAEAGNQPEEGIRAVVDVILNRIEDPRYPGTVDEVITQKGQFSVVASGRIWRLEPTERVREIVIDEMHKAPEDRVLESGYIAFNAEPIGKAPYTKIGGHYFGH